MPGGSTRPLAPWGLTAEQTSSLAQLLRGPASGGEPGRGAAAASGLAGPRPETDARFSERLVRAVAAVITPGQRAGFDRWRAEKEFAATRHGSRDVTLFLLGPAGALESRQIDVGVTDDHYAEVRAGPLKAGDRLVVRAHRAGVP